MSALSLSQLESRCATSPLKASVHAQITSLLEKQTKNGKPYLDVQLSDGESPVLVKIWEDTMAYKQARELGQGSFVAATGQWSRNDYGINVDRLELALLDDTAREALLAGDGKRREFIAAEWASIRNLCASLTDPRLNLVCGKFLDDFEAALHQTAAARTYHHARRGGLIEHIAQMMRTAEHVSMAYPDLNRDLLIAGVLFHDCGKLWENRFQSDGFEMPYRLAGELLGHIPLGIELVNHLWHQFDEHPEFRDESDPPSDEVKLHLQHLVAAHHGEHAFGSPTLPRTPEAVALHYIDNLDAKLEMFREGYRHAGELSDKVYQRHRPLPANLVAPLGKYQS